MFSRSVCAACLAICCLGTAAGQGVVVLSPRPAPRLQVAVLMPECRETLAARYTDTGTRMGIAQAMIENQLIEAGFQVVALDVPDWAGGDTRASQTQALAAARTAGAEYLIYGHLSTTRLLASESGHLAAGTYEATGKGTQAHGLHVDRPAYETAMQARILRVADGAVIASKHASSESAARSPSAHDLARRTTQRLMRELMPELEIVRRDEQRKRRPPLAIPD